MKPIVKLGVRVIGRTSRGSDLPTGLLSRAAHLSARRPVSTASVLGVIVFSLCFLPKASMASAFGTTTGAIVSFCQFSVCALLKQNTGKGAYGSTASASDTISKSTSASGGATVLNGSLSAHVAAGSGDVTMEMNAPYGASLYDPLPIMGTPGATGTIQFFMTIDPTFSGNAATNGLIAGEATGGLSVQAIPSYYTSYNPIYSEGSSQCFGAWSTPTCSSAGAPADVPVSVGEKLYLSAALNLSIEALAGYSGNQIIPTSDTLFDPAQIIVDPLTSGIGITTDSGLTYLTAPTSGGPGSTVPEPDSLLLFGSALVGLALTPLLARRKRHPKICRKSGA